MYTHIIIIIIVIVITIIITIIIITTIIIIVRQEEVTQGPFICGARTRPPPGRYSHFRTYDTPAWLLLWRSIFVDPDRISLRDIFSVLCFKVIQTSLM